MRTLFLLALSATAITAYAQEAKRDTIDKYIINRQQVAHFDGSQLNGKLISKYTIAYKNSGNVVEKNHVIFTAGYSDVPSRKGVNDVITTSVRIAENDVISVATTNEVGYSTDKDALLIVDGNVITSNGPGNTIPFALEIVVNAISLEKAREVASGMLIYRSQEELAF